jgi:predicted nucleic acid-binding protein
MVITDFKGKLIFLDTAPLIYFIEGHSQYQANLKRLFELNDDKLFTFITSVITLLEVLVKPLKENKTEIVEQYKSILTSAEGIEILEITINVAKKAAELRAKYNFRTPDALQLASALEYGANFFLTNDDRLKPVTEIPVITIGELL